MGLCYFPLAAGGIVGSNVAARIADKEYSKELLLLMVMCIRKCVLAWKLLDWASFYKQLP